MEMMESFVFYQVLSPDCFGDQNGQLVIDSVTGGTAPYLYSLSGEGLQQSPVFSGLAAGSYHLLVEDAGGCRIERTVIIQETAPLLLEMEKEITIQLGDSLHTMPAVSFTPAAVQWLPAEGLSCDTCLNVILKPLRSTHYELQLTDAEGCTITGSLLVTVIRDEGIYAPNAFSPNQDGINDRFYFFTDQSVSSVETFQVFDRWGGLVYDDPSIQAGSAEQGWDGRVNGQPASAGVYVYLIELTRVDGEQEVVTGEVVLLR